MKKSWLSLASLLLLVFFFIVLYVVLHYVGQQYNNGSTNTNNSVDQTPLKAIRVVKKITVKDEGEGCIEITPDGVVRTYSECNGDVTDVNRLANPKNILHLIQITSQIDFANYKVRPLGASLTLLIETDNGTETIYIPKGNGGGDISHTIDQINGDLPQPTSTLGPGEPTLTPAVGSPRPTSLTPTVQPTFGPSPTPGPSGTEPKSFTCGFAGDESKKPYNVSNYICSTEPSPAP